MKLRLLTFAFSVAIALAAAAPARAETILGEIAKADALRDKGDFDGAIELWSAWLKKGLKADSAFTAYFFRGIAKRDKGDNDGAIVDFTRAIELHPKEANTYFQRGDTKLAKGDSEGAIADYTKAIELGPPFVAAYYFQRGNTKLAKGDIEGAIADFTCVIEFNPQFPFPVAYFYRGNAKRAKGDLEGAIADYTHATELKPKDAYAYFSRGVAHYLQQSWPKAAGDFDKASQQDKPSDYGALMACVLQTRLGRGEAGRNALSLQLATRRDAQPGDWVSSLGGFLLGKLDEDALLRAADSPDAEKAPGQRCEAWYYAGMQRLAAGQKAEAASCFRKCIATEQKGFIEYALATAELKWLGER